MHNVKNTIVSYFVPHQNPYLFYIKTFTCNLKCLTPKFVLEDFHDMGHIITNGGKHVSSMDGDGYFLDRVVCNCVRPNSDEEADAGVVFPCCV